MDCTEGYNHPEFLASTSWLSDHLNNPNIRIIDTDISDQYQRAHIPESVVIDDHYEKSAESNRVHILNADGFARMAESLGIGKKTMVVAYDNSRGLYAARLWWALNYYGHSRVKVLNGGWRKWMSENRPVTTNDPPTVGNATFAPNANNSMMATMDQIKTDYQNPNVIIWDVRSIGEYVGTTSRGNQRTGHIPGAVHLEWLELVDQQTHLLKPAREIENILQSHGITRDKRIVVH